MVTGFQITSAAVSDRGLSEKRPQNEDAFLSIPQKGIFAVADGVGGAQAGEVASQMAMEILGEAFVNVDERIDAEDIMEAALRQANSAIHQMSTELPQLSQMATTVVALHIAGNIATIGHAGDSRLYRLDSDGNLYRETADHSMVAEEVRAGRMTEEEAENHPQKNIINRALGAEAEIEIELRTIMVDANTSFLLCSDGVTRHVTDIEIAELLHYGSDPEAICARIKELCFERGAEDNLTAVVLKIGSVAETAPEYEATPSFDETVQSPVEEIKNHDIPVTVVNEGEQAHEPTPTEDEEEVTVATAREPMTVAKTIELDDDDLLELDVPRTQRTGASPVNEQDPVIGSFAAASSSPAPHSGQTDAHAGDEPSMHISPADVSVDEAMVPANAAPSTLSASSASSMSNRQPEFAMFGNGEDSTAGGQQTSAIGRLAKSVGLLVLGSLIGLAAYHYLFANRTQPEPTPPVTQMESRNQPQTAFEENRRTLDKNPEAAVKRFEQEPNKDAENYFLIGRGYMLLGRYPEAKKAFEDARAKITAGEVDPTNAITIRTEIAIALASINDAAAQNLLRKELTDAKPSGAPAANTSVK